MRLHPHLATIRAVTIHLQYGKDGLDVDIPGSTVTVLEPTFVEGLPDEQEAFRESAAHPIGCAPLKQHVKAGESLAIVIPDMTRPLPSDRLLSWLFSELSHVPAKDITVIVGTGSHRGNTRAELAGMVGANVLAEYRVVNHDAHNPATMIQVGETESGPPVFMNRQYAEADRRILMGFVEPHFIAGYSGGYKAVFPGIVDIESIMHYHGATLIGDPRSTWGELDSNPTQQHVRKYGSLLPVDFCVNVTLNKHHAITHISCGDVLQAHAKACEFVKATSMVSCTGRFPIVVTTNGGYPLDQNLYQTVKGMTAAAEIIDEQGLIVTAARCDDGFPSHGNFQRLLFDHASPRALMNTIASDGFSMFDQWEAQLLGMILLKARIALYSDIPDDDVRRAHLQPIHDIGACIAEEVKRHGRDVPIAVLPQGPMTIPYIKNAHKVIPC